MRLSFLSGSYLILRLCFGAIFLLPPAGFAADPAPVGDGTAPLNGKVFCEHVEQQAFALVNQYRKENELPPLAWDEAIAREARVHSKAMAEGETGFGHSGFGDRAKRLSSLLPGFRGAGENVLMTDDPDAVADHAVTLWLHSPHHLKNIRGDFNYSAIGVWENESGAIYFTQIFLKFQPATNPG
jgi:uncharacterized protein YkwD